MMSLPIDVCPVYSMRIYWTDNGSARTARPELLMRKSCRALRMVGDSTRFLFVAFSRNASDTQMERILQNLVDEGVQVRDDIPTYKFLGYTESNIKSGQVMFFKEDENWTCQSLLKAFGNLDEVFLKDGPGKYAARLGLNFSSTADTITVPREEALLLADRETVDHSLATDGCSMIRESQAVLIRKQLHLSSSTSVFHIRVGGVKGVLVAYPDHLFESVCKHICRRMNKTDQPCEDLGTYKYSYRYSMLKYSGGPDTIEVHSYSYPPQGATLNFAFIVLLLSLNVPLESFKELLLEHLRLINDIAIDRDAALKFIFGEKDAKGEGFFQDVYEMLYAGFGLDEPHLQEALQKYQQYQYGNLRKKLSIKVKKSGYLLGVVDELGVLGENEVYVNLPERDGICTSKVFVARNPSYFPSDIRVFKAVNAPELSFLTNCIVFSRKSHHSVPDTMSGGDLDGDIYFVCWDQTLIPKQIEAPENRGSVDGNASPQIRELNDLNNSLIQNFVKLRYNTLVGAIANEWMRAIEESPRLADAPYPRKLAKLIEVALDILKTGADSERLWKELKSIKGAHAAETQGEAKDVVQLGDKPLDVLRGLVPAETSSPKPTAFETDPALILREDNRVEFDREVAMGKEIMEKFNRDLYSAITKDKVDSLQHPDSSSRPSSEIQSHADKVKKSYMEKYFPSCSIVSEENKQCYIRASAWYQVGYESRKSAFAWLGARHLCHTKAASTNGGKPGFIIGALKQT